MTIQDAKDQIRGAITAYLTKDQYGRYAIPVERQRPLFLMGPPGIGKTAVMEQVASELGVGLVSYSMTHHTRQSALGLPFITKMSFDGTEYSVSEYTMSEIIASVYRMMNETGLRQGILFLDEINCVSETLAPAMLQFLQFKTFGRHKVPDGWVVVTAGNPPEYNRSVREFDIVTWDRLKRIDVEPDYGVWKQHALRQGVHPAITTYLDVKRDDFYRVETAVDGKRFVTARGWSDLSDMIRLYEQHGLPVDEKLVRQYLQSPKIARSFATYYDLFEKYRSDYQVEAILDGSAGEEILERAKSAKFDERLSLIGLLLSAVGKDLKAVCLREDALGEYFKVLKRVRDRRDSEKTRVLLKEEAEALRGRIERGRASSSLSKDSETALLDCIAELEHAWGALTDVSEKKAFDVLRTGFADLRDDLKARADRARTRLTRLFDFCDAAFGEGQENLIVVTDLTADWYASRFLSRYGCEAYFAHNRELLFYERQKELMNELELLEQEEAEL